MNAGFGRSLWVEGSHLCGLTWLGGRLWYSDAGLEAIVAVDPGTGEVLARLSCPEVRTGLTASASGTRLVQVVGTDKRLRSLDTTTGHIMDEAPNPRPGGELCGLQDTPAGLWTGYKRPPVLELRRHEDHEAILSIAVDEDVADVTVARGFVVFANHPDGRLNVVDPARGRIVQVIPVRGNPTGLTWDGQRFWYCDYAECHLRSVASSLDPPEFLQETPLQGG